MSRRWLAEIRDALGTCWYLAVALAYCAVFAVVYQAGYVFWYRVLDEPIRRLVYWIMGC